MRINIVRAIGVKELREALRDRKTLLLTILLPMLLYPGLMLLVTQVATTQLAELESQVPTVVIAGAVESPLAAAVAEASGVAAVLDADADLDPFASGADAVVLIEAQDGSGYSGATVHYRSVLDASRMAAERVGAAIADFEDAESLARVEAAGLGASALNPVNATEVDLSPVQQRGGHVLGSILPMLVLITVMMGALYPAIDVTAGEKERGTIQTLFTAPITAAEVVAGKYLAVVGLAMVTGAANLGSLALVFSHNLILAGELRSDIDFSISPVVLLGLAVAIAYIAALVAAALMCAAVMARSYKDAQTWVTPVYLLCMVPGMVAQMPGFELSDSTALIPIAGPVLLMKSMLLNGVSAVWLFKVGAGAIAHVALALFAATRLFDAEDVITGGRPTWGALGSGRRLTPTPTASEAMAWYAASFLLLYYGGSTLQAKSPQIGLVITLWGLLLVPTLALAWRLRVDLRETFAVRRAPATVWAASVLLGASAFIWIGLINEAFQSWVLRPAPELIEQMAADMERFFPRPDSAWEWVALIAVGALSPAICEELLFRGFMLSGLRTAMRPVVAGVVVALLFGLFHLSIYRLFGTAALGIVMAMLVLRGGSIGPSMLFHGINNALALVLMQLEPDLADQEMLFKRALIPAVVATAVGIVLLWRTRSTDAAPPREG